jgi:integrase
VLRKLRAGRQLLPRLELCSVPAGQTGRPSKSLTLSQADAVLRAAEASPLHAYIVLSLLIGARTEELRALRWTDVDLDGRPDVTPPVPPSISVVRSVRIGGDTKTRRSRRRLAMPRRCVTALRRQREQLGEPAGDGLVLRPQQALHSMRTTTGNNFDRCWRKARPPWTAFFQPKTGQTLR